MCHVCFFNRLNTKQSFFIYKIQMSTGQINFENLLNGNETVLS